MPRLPFTRASALEGEVAETAAEQSEAGKSRPEGLNQRLFLILMMGTVTPFGVGTSRRSIAT